MRNRCMLEKMAAGMALAAAVMAGAAILPGSGHGLVSRAYAADASNQNSQNISGGGTSTEDKLDKTDSTDSDMATSGNSDDGSGIYDFKDNKTTGTVTITKKWDDGLTNAEREIPDMYLSTEKPSKSLKGNTVIFHGNGLKFADGTDENMVVYNSSGQIVEGSYKEAVGTGVAWYTDKTCTQKVEISDDGVPQVGLTGDLDLWAKEMTFEIKGYFHDQSVIKNEFDCLIPTTVTEIIFTDETKPKTKEAIDVDADGDGGVVAWLDDNAGTVMKVSTQFPGIKVQAAKDSSMMFYNRNKLQKIDFKMLDTQNVTDMSYMFENCEELRTLDLTLLNTQNVTKMQEMFYNCNKLLSLNLSSFNTTKTTDMRSIFFNCRSLTEINLSSFDTQNVTYMSCMFAWCTNLKKIDCSKMNANNVEDANDMFVMCKKAKAILLPNFSDKLTTISEYTNMYMYNTSSLAAPGMFYGCSSITALDLSPLSASKVRNLEYMFSGCSSLTNLDLTPLDTQNVTDMREMFSDCSGLTSLDLSPLDTQKVTNMNSMFSDCSGLTSLDLSPLDTQKVTNMESMFSGCSGLTSLDLTPLNTQKVTNMSEMFYDCRGLTSLDLTPLDTQNVADMRRMFSNCSALTSLTTGTTFKFVGTNYVLSGTWQNTAGETFNGNYNTANFPSNVADTYTKISS